MNKKSRIIALAIAIIVIGIIAVIFIVKWNNEISKVEHSELSGDILNEEVQTGEIPDILEITVSVYDKEGLNIYEQNIETDKEYLSEALAEISDLELVIEDGQYGDFITSIKGISQGDNYYWSYYIDGEYAPTGISTCKIEEEKKYEFKIEKFGE